MAQAAASDILTVCVRATLATTAPSRGLNSCEMQLSADGRTSAGGLPASLAETVLRRDCRLRPCFFLPPILPSFLPSHHQKGREFSLSSISLPVLPY